jgi:hypothetical protein
MVKSRNNYDKMTVSKQSQSSYKLDESKPKMHNMTAWKINSPALKENIEESARSCIQLKVNMSTPSFEKEFPEKCIKKQKVNNFINISEKE